VVYSVEMRARMEIKALELRRQGHSIASISRQLAISNQTLRNWLNGCVSFNKQFEIASSEVYEELLETNLVKLAKGYEQREVTREYVTEEYINDELISVKKIERIKEVAPDLKTLQILARRYAKDLDDTKREIIDEHINIKISQKDRALDITERAKLLSIIDDCDDVIIDSFESHYNDSEEFDI
jgi:transposase-like protein